jgi:hypothetical protein
MNGMGGGGDHFFGARNLCGLGFAGCGVLGFVWVWGFVLRVFGPWRIVGWVGCEVAVVSDTDDSSGRQLPQR